MAVNLVFSDGPVTDLGSNVPLVFGSTSETNIVAVAINLSALPVLSMIGGEQIAYDVAIDFSDIPVVAVTMTYDNAVSRGPRRTVTGVWQEAVPLPAQVESPWQEPTSMPLSVSQLIVDALPLHDVEINAAWQQATNATVMRTSGWQEAAPLHPPSTSIVFQQGTPARRERTTAFEEARAMRPPTTTMVWQETLRIHRTRTTRYQEAVPVHRAILSRAADADGLVRSWIVPWQEARPPGLGTSTVTPPEPPDDLCYTPPIGSNVPLVFDAAWDDGTTLVFTCDNHPVLPPATITVPIREVYMVSNTVSLTLADGTVIPCTSFTLSIDYQSWTWNLNASVAYSALSMFGFDSSGDPVQVWAHINGEVFKLFVQMAESARTFPTGAITLTGIGLISTLDAPYAPTLTFDNAADARTAQQIANDVLTDNGAPIGWDVEWGFTDWLVPAGSWSFQGTYATALQAIAAAAGGYLQPHPTDQVARILPLYPTAPWDWAGLTPDFELPSSVTAVEGIAWTSKPIYNLVYVSGTTDAGILGHVKRTGTAGDLEATMVTDQLITHADAARQRGLSILANTGKQALVTLKLPVLAETGVILPGKFVRYVDGATTRIGIVRSTSVDVAFPAVWQTIGVETHVS